MSGEQNYREPEYDGRDDAYEEDEGFAYCVKSDSEKEKNERFDREQKKEQHKCKCRCECDCDSKLRPEPKPKRPCRCGGTEFKEPKMKITNCCPKLLCRCTGKRCCCKCLDTCCDNHPCSCGADA